MEANEIKFKTIQAMNDIKYIPEGYTELCQSYIRRRLGLENTDENNKIIEEAIKIHFEQQGEKNENYR